MMIPTMRPVAEDPQILHEKPSIKAVAAAVRTKKIAVVTYVDEFSAFVGLPSLPTRAVAIPIIDERSPRIA